MTNVQDAALDKIAVIGGGRWARTYLRTLSKILPIETEFFALSPRNAAGLRAWAARDKLAGRMSIFSNWPDFDASFPSLAIVVNAAGDHYDATERLLTSKIPTLVEKPLTTSPDRARRLLQLSEQHHVMLAAAHVLLFADYLVQFAELAKNIKHVEEVSITWADSGEESREGEVKSYDASIPVFEDVVPHIISMLSMIIAFENVHCESVHVERGGARVRITCVVANIRCQIDVSRNATHRIRRIKVQGVDTIAEVDFAKEPGTILSNSRTISPSYSYGDRPLSAMISCFIDSVSRKSLDPRLDPAIGLIACCFSDTIRSHYQAAQLTWLEGASAYHDDITEDLHYALKEIMLSASHQLEGTGDDVILQIWRVLKSDERSRAFEKLRARRPALIVSRPAT